MSPLALEREKGEITDATTKLSQLENRKRSFAAQLEALKSELNEWSTKLDEIKERRFRKTIEAKETSSNCYYYSAL